MLQPLDLILQFLIDLVHFLNLGLVPLQVCHQLLALLGHLVAILTQKVEFLLVQLVLFDLLLNLFLQLLDAGCGLFQLLAFLCGLLFKVLDSCLEFRLLVFELLCILFKFFLNLKAFIDGFRALIVLLTLLLGHLSLEVSLILFFVSLCFGY